jgi:outer membrane lipoprotein-sorting protein
MFILSRNRIWFFALLAALVLACGVLIYRFVLPKGTPQEQLTNEIERELAHIRTVQGRLTISLQDVTLEQELWVERPAKLRTETSTGPSGFQGAIVVLNDQEGWVYSPALEMATVVNRANYQPDVAGESGAGSLLERMPDSILNALHSGSPVHLGDREAVAGRSATLVELTIPPGDPSFPEGPLQVWLDDQFSYPLAWRDSTGRSLRFSMVRFNQDVDPVIFTFLPPPGVSVHRVEATPE